MVQRIHNADCTCCRHTRGMLPSSIDFSQQCIADGFVWRDPRPEPPLLPPSSFRSGQYSIVRA